MRRTLLIRPGAIGDSILGFPALEHLRSDYTEVWVRSEILPLVGSFCNSARSIASTGLDLLEIEPSKKTIDELASFHEIHSWYGANRAEFRNVVRELPFVFHTALPPDDGSVHAADFFAEQVGAPIPAVPRIPLKGPWHGRMVIHPYSGSVRKNWPYERWVELSRRMPVEWAQDRFEDLGELAAWIAGASVFVGNDSGITHLAAAVGTPVVALFGATNPLVWSPRGDKVRVIERGQMGDIGVEDVLHAVREFL